MSQPSSVDPDALRAPTEVPGAQRQIVVGGQLYQRVDTPAVVKPESLNPARKLSVCAICSRRLRTDHFRKHLRAKHKMTVAHYEFVTGQTVKALAKLEKAVDEFRDPTNLLALSRRLVEDERFVRSLAAEVGETLLHGPIRQSLRSALAAAIVTRTDRYAQAQERLREIERRLNEPWRLDQGGENHGPTPTSELLALLRETRSDMAQTEDVLLKAVRLAVDEARGRDDPIALPGGGTGRYTGETEKIPVPPSLTAEERETVRGLLVALKRSVEAHSAKNGNGRVLDAVQTSAQPPTVDDDVTDFGP